MIRVTAAGRPISTAVAIAVGGADERRLVTPGSPGSFSEIRAVTVNLPALTARELKVWAHRIMAGGNSEPLPALVELESSAPMAASSLKLVGGQAGLRFPGACRLTITFPESGVS